MSLTAKYATITLSDGRGRIVRLIWKGRVEVEVSDGPVDGADVSTCADAGPQECDAIGRHAATEDDGQIFVMPIGRSFIDHGRSFDHLPGRKVFGVAGADPTRIAYVEMLVTECGHRIEVGAGVCTHLESGGRAAVHCSLRARATARMEALRTVNALLRRGDLTVSWRAPQMIEALLEWDGSRWSPHAPFVRALLCAVMEGQPQTGRG